MSIFEKIFTKLLLVEVTTWNQGTLTTNIGPNFRKATDMFGLKPTQRHRKIIKDPGFRKHAQTVPDMHKVDPKSLQAMNDLKIANSGRKVLSQDEVQKLCTQFGVSRLNPTTPKSLGNTGIILKYDPNLRGYILEK